MKTVTLTDEVLLQSISKKEMCLLRRSDEQRCCSFFHLRTVENQTCNEVVLAALFS